MVPSTSQAILDLTLTPSGEQIAYNLITTDQILMQFDRVTYLTWFHKSNKMGNYTLTTP